uniref:Chemokine (C-C motif) ligand 44 n=1 Tax=Erpetoichthys calabaricus TaxID=27687 RepID=A0A8C4SYD7_ERPCA
MLKEASLLRKYNRLCPFLHSASVLAVHKFSFSFQAKDVQVLQDVQCCMQYSKGSVRLRDVLYFEMQVDGPDSFLLCTCPNQRNLASLTLPLNHPT